MDKGTTHRPVRTIGRKLLVHRSCFAVDVSTRGEPEGTVLSMDDIVPMKNRTQWPRLSRGDFVRIGLWFLARAIRP